MDIMQKINKGNIFIKNHYDDVVKNGSRQPIPEMPWIYENNYALKGDHVKEYFLSMQGDNGSNTNFSVNVIKRELAKIEDEIQKHLYTRKQGALMCQRELLQAFLEANSDAGSPDVVTMTELNQYLKSHDDKVTIYWNMI